MPAPLTINQAADLVDLSIQNVYEKSSEPEAQYKKYFNFRKTDDYLDKDSSLSGLGEADFVDENAIIVSDIQVQGFDKTYTQNMVGIIVPFTFKMWKFGITKRNLNRVAKELKASQNRKREKLCAERLTNGFESTNYTHSGQKGNTTIQTGGGDSLGAFDDDHTREDGGTNMNNFVYNGSTYNLALDYAGLKGAHRTASSMVDPRGNPRPANLDTVVVKNGSTNFFKAKEIWKAIKNNKIPESFDNDGSGVPTFNLLALDYLTTSGQWFMFDSSRALTEEEGFQFVESQGIMVDPVNVVYKTKEIQTSTTSLYDLGHNDVTRSWVGSIGDESNPTS